MCELWHATSVTLVMSVVYFLTHQQVRFPCLLLLPGLDLQSKANRLSLALCQLRPHPIDVAGLCVEGGQQTRAHEHRVGIQVFSGEV